MYFTNAITLAGRSIQPGTVFYRRDQRSTCRVTRIYGYKNESMQIGYHCILSADPQMEYFASLDTMRAILEYDGKPIHLNATWHDSIEVDGEFYACRKHLRAAFGGNIPRPYVDEGYSPAENYQPHHTALDEWEFTRLSDNQRVKLYELGSWGDCSFETDFITADYEVAHAAFVNDTGHAPVWKEK